MSDTKLHNAAKVGLMRCLMAGLYDWLLVLAIMMVASVPVVAITDAPVSPGQIWYRLALVTVAAVFFIAFWAIGGQTLGMRAWRIKVVQTDGSEVTATQATSRFAGALVSALAGGLGFVWMLFSREKLSWHDQWSGTRLILLPKTKKKNATEKKSRD
jgi:uncharacterized RDD family membrane protein YckC